MVHKGLTRLLSILVFGCSWVTEPEPSELVRELQPCTVSGRTAMCLRFDVYEDREQEAGRIIPIQGVVLPATGATQLKADPVVFMAGGPGQASTNLADFIARQFPVMHRQRDFVFIDQRGTGGSNRLSCPGPLPSGELSLFGALLPLDHVRTCRAALEQHADLARYASPNAADDIADALAWMDYDHVNLFGMSYGTRLALVLMRRHSDLVRSVVVNGVAPPDRIAYLEGPIRLDEAINWSIAECAGSPSCTSSFGDLRAKFDSLVSRLSTGPVDTRVTLSNGTTPSVGFSRDDFAYAIRGMLYGTLADSLPPWISRTHDTDDWSHFSTYYVQRSNWVATDFSTGLHLSVMCSEDITHVTDADKQHADAISFMGASLVRRYERACAEWPHGTLPASFKDPIQSDEAVLVISGERDPATPAAWGDDLVSRLTNAVHFKLTGEGHVPLDGCVPALVGDFINRGSAQAIAHTCSTVP